MKKLKEILNEKWETSPPNTMNLYRKAKKANDELRDHFKYDDYNHTKALQNYSNSSKELNNYHWNKSQNSSNVYVNRDNEDDTKKMDKAINHIKAHRDIQVYSGTRHDPRKIKDKDGIVEHPAYLSTSINRSVAENFAKRNDRQNMEKSTVGLHVRHRHLLKFTIPKGHPVAHLDYGEDEMVLPRGTKLKHLRTTTKVHTVPPADFDGAETLEYHNHTHHMKIV